MKYAIRLVAYCEAVVEADSVEEAEQLAMEDISLYEYEVDSAECTDILDTKEKEERAIRHCNVVV